MTDNFMTFSHALRELQFRSELRKSFMQKETSEEVCDELNISSAMATELKIILSNPPNNGNDSVSGASSDELEETAIETVTSAEAFLERSFAQLQTGARVLMLMSVTMFLFGVGFLVIAVVRSFTHPDSAQVTGVIGGIGVIQIVFLFYRNPLRDIGRSISNSQQAKIVVMSYMLGVSLIAKSLKGTTTEKEQQALTVLTQQALEQLERFTEEKTDQKDAKAFCNKAEEATAFDQ